jgi:hypothetical protein
MEAVNGVTKVRGVTETATARVLEEVEVHHRQAVGLVTAKLPRLEGRLAGFVDSFDMDIELLVAIWEKLIWSEWMSDLFYYVNCMVY